MNNRTRCITGAALALAALAAPGALFAGIGCRLFKPQTFYGTVGLYFLSKGRRAGSFKLALGKQYVNLGVVWGFDLLHRFRRGSRQAYRRQFVQRVLRSG